MSWSIGNCALLAEFYGRLRAQARSAQTRIETDDQAPEFVKAVRHASTGLLSRDEVERYTRLDPANALLRALHEVVIGRGAWRLLWIAPSLPYYEPGGAFADSRVASFTKRLVFSCWRVVPKAIASVLSYEAEREMIQSFRKKSRNTAEARKKQHALLRFVFSKGRPTGMPVLGLIYPCRWLARTFDPLVLGRQSSSSTLLHPSEIISLVATVIRSELSPDLEAASRRPGPVDESWYWAAPLLLDQKHHRTETHRWFGQPNLAEDWAGGQAAQEVAQGWGTHVQQARSYLDGRIELGPPPADLCEVTAMLAIAGPGVASLRALNRIAAGAKDQEASIRTSAAALAHSFLHLFNLPEVMALLRDRKRDMPYWQSVLSYCVAGNLQAVLDEYAHVLVESLGVVGQAPPQIASEVSKEMQRCLALRTATAQADLLSVSSRRVRLDYTFCPTRSAMRFGDQSPKTVMNLLR